MKDYVSFANYETHFLIDCEVYSDLRQLLFETAVFLNENFENLSSTEKLSFLMQRRDIQFLLGSALNKMFARRKKMFFLLYFSMNYRDFSVKSKLIISLFQTVKLSLSISLFQKIGFS